MLKCLWISRDLPFPLDAGDKIYSAQLARALAEAGTQVRFLASTTYDASLPAQWPIEWRPIHHCKRHPVSALLSTLPSVAATHATRTYRNVLQQQLAEPWDCIVLDSYGSGWALKACLQAARSARGATPVLVYVSHNHEEALWRSMARHTRGSRLRKLALWQNYRKVRSLERALVRNVDLITAITEEDAQAYRDYAPHVPKVALTPGYAGGIAEPRALGAETPRRVALIGSFRWAVKQENLRRFVAAADPAFAQCGAHLDVVGEVPPELLRSLGPLRATHFHGFVSNPADVLRSARMAVVPELIGGGFKLKLLDYIFGRVPVATLSVAAAGLPARTRASMLCRDDLRSLIASICEVIDDFDRLNRMQESALAEARAQFDWKDRGRALAGAIRRCAAARDCTATSLAEVLHG